MAQTRWRARVVHAILGRIRLRLDEDGYDRSLDGIDTLRFVAGVLSLEPKPAARSLVITYDPGVTTEAAVLAELTRAVLDVETTPSDGTAPARTARSASAAGDHLSGVSAASEDHAAASSAPRERWRRTRSDPKQAQDDGAGNAKAAADDRSHGRSPLMEALIGPPPKLDRRFAESLALSAVSLLAARRVGVALGGGTTLPAYFAIWFALRRLTGAGRRR